MISDLIGQLSELGYPVYDTRSPDNAVPPFIVVAGGEAEPHHERSVGGQNLGVYDHIRVTCTAGTPSGARIVHRNMRAVMAPDGYPKVLGQYQLRLSDHQGAQIDTETVIYKTDRHPAYFVDIYRVER